MRRPSDGKRARFESLCCPGVLFRRQRFYSKRLLLGAFASEAARLYTVDALLFLHSRGMLICVCDVTAHVRVVLSELGGVFNVTDVHAQRRSRVGNLAMSRKKLLATDEARVHFCGVFISGEACRNINSYLLLERPDDLLVWLPSVSFVKPNHCPSPPSMRVLRPILVCHLPHSKLSERLLVLDKL